MVLIVWLYSIFFAAVPALDIGYSRYVPEGFLTSCSFDYLDRSMRARIFMFVFFVCAWAVPFAIITYCYYHILRAVNAARQIRAAAKDARKKTEVKVAGVVLAIIALWFVAWTPYSIVALLGISGNEQLITPLVSMVPAVFCKSAACLDPYVYAITHPRFQMELRRMCGRPLARGRSVGWQSQSQSRCASMRSTSTMRASVRSSSGAEGVAATSTSVGGVQRSAYGSMRRGGGGGGRRGGMMMSEGGRMMESRMVSTISEESSQMEMTKL